MPVHNADVAAVFNETADLLELEDANPFRVRAYRNAARVVGDLRADIGTLVAAGSDLTELPGIGEDLAAKIREIAATGSCALMRELRGHTSGALVELLTIPGLGPKRVRALNRELKIQTVDQLADAARTGRVRRLPGFGERTEANILKAIASRTRAGKRLSLAIAAQYAEPLVAYLRAGPGVEAAEVAGSYRRRKETVGDIDILATAARTGPVIARFVAYDEVSRVLARGTTRASVVLRAGLQVDLRVVKPASYGATLHYFTGSKPHNIAVRQLGQQAGLKINEYGVFRGDKRVAGATEQSVFASVGLTWIPPELREDRGEIEAAQAGRLPRLVEAADLRGDLHSHTTATDGRNTLREMAAAAQRRGFEYLAVTDHSQRVRMAHGLNPERLLVQLDEIDHLNRELKGLTLLKGIEVDILKDGRLDLPDEVLAQLDLVIGSVHSHFDLPKEKQTARVLKAMDHPYFSILGHPTGRLIPRRQPYDIDLPRLLRHARERGCFVELDAHPERLDLNDLHCRMAKDEGVLVSIDSDAHSVDDFDNLVFGVGQARRGWIEKRDVLNTRPLRELRALLAAARG